MIRSRPENLIRNALFLCLLLVPGSVMLFSVRQDVSLREARTLARKPEWVELLRQPFQFAALWDAYLKDHFGARDALLDLNALLRRTLDSPASGMAIVGKQGWLFYGEGLLPSSETTKDIDQKVARQVELIASIERRLEMQGTPFLVVLTPDKQSLYPEYLPDWLERVPKSQIMNALVAGVRARGVKVIDVIEQLAPLKSSFPMFFLTDTHWTPTGSALAFNEITGLSRGLLRPVQVPTGGQLVAGAPHDLSRMAGFDGEPEDWSIPGFTSSYPNAVREELQIANGSQQTSFMLRREGSGSKLLIVGDSFSAHWPAFALESANTVYWSHHNQCLANWPKLLALKVDLVIYQMLERTIGCPPLDPGFLDAIQTSAD